MRRLQILVNRIRRCRDCGLYKTRKHTVPGEGSDKAKIIFIGQAPGKQEDIFARPFVGRAGKFLDELLIKNQINRNRCYITSILKCYPQGNRVPKKDEIAACHKYLLKQIELINPKVIVCLGKIAEQEIRKMKNIKQKIIFTYHPAAGMRFPKIRKKMEKDFKKIKELT